ncbi:hypothetical protein SVIOM74S_07083 [Streptomyces violarus]
MTVAVAALPDIQAEVLVSEILTLSPPAPRYGIPA